MKKYSNLLKRISSNGLVRIIALAIILCMPVALSSCDSFISIDETDTAANNLPQLNPHDGINYTSSVDLYYRFCATPYLAPRTINVQLSSNERSEETIMRALLAGEGTSGIYTSAIPPNVELVSIMNSGDLLFVTLNDAFLDDSLYATEEIKRIAVCEIVNTLTAHSGHSVQILIDRGDTGTGERVSYRELGFEEKYDIRTDYAAPFNFTKSIVATPQAVLDYTLNCLKKGDYTKAALLFTSTVKKRGVTSDEIMHISDIYDIESYKISRVDVNGNTATAYIQLTFTDVESNKKQTFDGAIELEKYESVYRVPYETFMEALRGIGK